MRIFALLLLSAASALAYVHSTDGSDRLYRTDNTNIQFNLNNLAVGGLMNSSGQVWISAGSDIPRATAAAISTWNNVSTANIHFAPVQTTTSLDGTPGLNVIAFDDTPEVRQVLGSALAITIGYVVPKGAVALDRTDILFSPQHVFSTTFAAGSYDYQAVLTHELGHSLGADHSGVLSATMFQASSPGNAAQTVLSADDQAFLSESYPKQNSYGTLSGTVRDSGGNVLRSALVSAQDSATGVLVGSVSDAVDGKFSFLVPPGHYQLWAEPLTGMVAVANLYFPKSQTVDTAFQVGTPGNPVTVSAGITTAADIATAAGTSPIVIKYAGAAPINSSDGFEIYAGPSYLPSQQQVNLVFEATGLGFELTESNFSVVGPLTINPGSVLALGRSQYQISFTVPAVSTVTAASLFINYKGNTAVYSGGLVIQPVAPRFAANGLGNVFTYASGAVAPGEIVAIFGTNVGPAVPIAGGVDGGGNLVTGLSGIQVTFDGVQAPIFFASSGQINVEVPYEVAGKSTVNVVITSGTTASSPVAIPVQNAVPGLFTSALNSDGTVNTVTNPGLVGQYVVLFGTGLGALPGVGTGQLVAGTAVVPGATLTVDGVVATPSYAGAAPGFTGLDQVNVVGLTSGQHMVAVGLPGGVSSNAIPVWIK